MSRARRPPIFIDLDETLVFARERSPSATEAECAARSCRPIGEYDVIVRPEAAEILTLCRAGGREVFLFTMAGFGFACEVSRVFGLGFGESSIFSFAMILNCRRGLCPHGALVDDRPYTDANTRVKADALGLSAEGVWRIPPFEPPRYLSAKLFLSGLPLRLARLDASARTSAH